MYTSLSRYKSRFQFQKSVPITKSSFQKNARVRLGNGTLESLLTYLTRTVPSTVQNHQTIRNNIITVLYTTLIAQKDVILDNFYNRSLKVSNSIEDMDEVSLMSLDRLSNTKESKYKNNVRNLHYLGILKQTTTDIKGLRPYLVVLEELYRHWILDYKLLTPSAIHYFSQNTVGSILSAFYFRASIMNPYLVYSILSHLSELVNMSVPNTRQNQQPKLSIFTPTLGWSSYFMGASQLSVKRYTGIDVLKNVCKKTIAYAKQFPHINTTIYCKPSEELAHTLSFIKTHRNSYDIVFFSPPYYKLEQYENVMNRYNSFEDWIASYWRPTIKMCHQVLKREGVLSFIFSLYDTNKQQLNKMTDLTDMKFTLLKSFPILNSTNDLTQTGNQERLYIYYKS